jgi:hypothetical protein
MSRKNDLRQIQREKASLLRKDERLRGDLRWQFASLFMYVELADRLVSLLARLIVGRRPPATRRRRFWRRR